MIESINPATGLPVGSVDETPPEDVIDMVHSCRGAQEAWFDASDAKGRASCLRGLTALVLERIDELASIVSEETGKPRFEAIDSDVMPTVSMIQWCADQTHVVDIERRLSLGRLGLAMRLAGRSSTMLRGPLGVIGLITPWNFPLSIPMTQAAMAIAAGNSVLIKPSPLSPLTASMIPALFEEAGFPKGLVVVAQGGEDVGRAVASSDVDRIVFTGGWRTGVDVMRSASGRLTPVTLELGGKDPMIVLDDCALDRTVAGATWGAFVNAGQVCAGVKRVLVHHGIHDRFLGNLVSNASRLRIGWDPDGDGVDMGPLIEPAAVDRMEDVVERALSQGARLMSGGIRHGGCFFPPTVLADVTPEMDVFREEVFGPVVTVTSFDDDDSAVTLANDSDFSLSASIWSRDLGRARSLARRVDGGTVTINNVAYTYGLPTTPWGGGGKSGFGRSHGYLGLEEMTSPRHIHVDRGKLQREIWWHPYDSESHDSMRSLMGMGFAKGGWKGFIGLPSILRTMRRRDHP